MEVIKKKCTICGKEISSLYESQLNYNYQAHLLSCKNKKDKNDK